ncbi:hypothetical protein WMY93_011964 [Mugilogobius chulae]|uniref:Neural cell adhesion molecule L1 n=1 Tax=Mugilogobius chulae TaxID=88201 RepID=A0AAW0PA81_9GOBI
MPHTQRQQGGSRGQCWSRLPHLFLLLLALGSQPIRAAIHIPSTYHISDLKKPPTITTQPESVTVFSVEDFVMTCEASGNPAPIFRWTKDGEEFDPGVDPELKVTESAGSFVFYTLSNTMDSRYQGKYVCLASNELGTAVSNEAILSIDAPPAQQKEKKVSVKTEEGNSMVLKCNPPQSAMEPIIHWMDWRLLHIALSERVMHGTDGNLYFAHVTTKDSRDDYTCNVQYLATRTILAKEPISVTVTPSAPYWVKEPMSQLYAPGETVKLDCQADGIPTPTISWTINGAPLSAVDKEPRRVSAGGSLTLKDVNFGDTAIYQCQASNKHGTILTNINVYVIELDPQILTKDGVSYDFVEGQKALLECDTFGSPKPKVTWESESTSSLLSETRVNLLTNGALEILNVTQDDEGLYTCSVENTNMSVSAQLEILTRTLSHLQLLSSVDSKLSPPFIQWRKNDQKIFESHSDDRYTFEGSDLIISNVQQVDEGVYTCQVITDLDMAEASGTLTLYDRPDPPTLLKISNAKERALTLSWTPGDEHNSPVIGPDMNPEDVRSDSTDPDTLVITWEEMDKRDFNGPDFRYRVMWRRVVGSGPNWNINYTTSPPLFLQDIGTFAAFDIKVQAVNKEGEGPDPDPVIGYSGEDVPGPPKSLTLDSNSETEITLRWSPPEEPNGVLKGYLLRYHQTPPVNISVSVGESSANFSWVAKKRHRSVSFQIEYINKNDGSEWKKVEKVDSSLPFYQLRGLTPGSHYRMRLSYNNSTFWEDDFDTEGTAMMERQPHFPTEGWFIGLVSAIALLLLILLILCFIKRSKGGKYSVKDKEEGPLDSEARPMKDETFGEYRSLESDLEEKCTASQPSLCEESKLCSQDNLDFNGSSAITTELNLDESLVSQFSRPSNVPDNNLQPTNNGLNNAVTILD